MTDWQHGGESGGAPEYQGPPAGQFGGAQTPPNPQYGQPAQYPQYPAAQNPQYPPSPYPPQYGYPVPVAYPMPYQGAPSGPRRPGLVMASAVLGYVNAGLLILAGAILLFGGSIANDLEDAANSSTHYGTELVIDGLINFVAAGLLIAGAVTFSGRKANGRVLLSVGNVIVIAETIYWLVRFNDISINTDGIIVYAVVFGALAVLPLAFSFTGDINRWLAPSAPQHA